MLALGGGARPVLAVWLPANMMITDGSNIIMKSLCSSMFQSGGYILTIVQKENK